MISIPIVNDLKSNEGTEYFMVQLSVYSNVPDDIAVSLASVREATVYIQDEIVLSFQNKHVEVEEGENLTLIVSASAASDQDFNITVNITGNSAHCKLKYIIIHLSCMT